MSWRSAAPWLLLLALVALFGARGLPRRGDSGSGRGGLDIGRGARVDVRVQRVVDGDTIVVRKGDSEDRVRYIGMDTPETVKPNTPVQCFGKAASAFNERLVSGEEVTLRTDAEPRDRYGRPARIRLPPPGRAVRQRRTGARWLCHDADNPAERGPRGSLPGTGALSAQHRARAVARLLSYVDSG